MDTWAGALEGGAISGTGWPLYGSVYPYASCGHAGSKQPVGLLGRHRRLHLGFWSHAIGRRPGEEAEPAALRALLLLHFSARHLLLQHITHAPFPVPVQMPTGCQLPPGQRLCLPPSCCGPSPGRSPAQAGPQILVNGRMTEQTPPGRAEGVWSAGMVHLSLLDKH